MEAPEAGEWYAFPNALTRGYTRHLVVWADRHIAQLACRYIVETVSASGQVGHPCCPECERLSAEWWRPRGGG